jgi:hypothetical protein
MWLTFRSRQLSETEPAAAVDRGLLECVTAANVLASMCRFLLSIVPKYYTLFKINVFILCYLTMMFQEKALNRV